MCYTVFTELRCPNCGDVIGSTSSRAKTLICPSGEYCPTRNSYPLPQRTTVLKHYAPCMRCEGDDDGGYGGSGYYGGGRRANRPLQIYAPREVRGGSSQSRTNNHGEFAGRGSGSDSRTNPNSHRDDSSGGTSVHMRIVIQDGADTTQTQSHNQIYDQAPHSVAHGGREGGSSRCDECGGRTPYAGRFYCDRCLANVSEEIAAVDRRRRRDLESSYGSDFRYGPSRYGSPSYGPSSYGSRDTRPRRTGGNFFCF